MGYMKRIYCQKHNTISNLRYVLLMGPCDQFFYFIWSLFQLFRALPPGLLPEQNFEIIETTTTLVDTTLKMPYAGARPKQKATVTLAPQPQLREETVLKRHPYCVSLGTPVTQEVPPKCTCNKEVLF